MYNYISDKKGIWGVIYLEGKASLFSGGFRLSGILKLGHPSIFSQWMEGKNRASIF